jgi:CDP-diacylglycerol--glycerol-3-phosphate 3-phosphatidyltransferase
LLKHLPNALTLLRLVLAPIIAWLLWTALRMAPGEASYPSAAAYLTAAAVAFLVAALTDLFDGMAARAFNAHSKLGRVIDPIADKALVGLPLIVISINAWQGEHPAWAVIAIATAVIVTRDTLMTILRLAAPDGEGVRVSTLAKMKTALELFVVGSLLTLLAALANAAQPNRAALVAAPYGAAVEVVWVAMLVLSALLSAFTAYQYLAVSTRKV